MRTLQTQLDTSNRKAKTAETILRTITQERDSAVSQLSVAYVTIKQLRAENEDIREENKVLRGHTHTLTENLENTTRKSRKLTSTSDNQRIATKALNVQNSPSKATRFAKHSSRHSGAQEANATGNADMFDLTPRPQLATDISRKAIQQDHDEGSEESEASVYEVPRNKGKGKLAAMPTSSLHDRAADEDSSRNLTYLSFLDSNEVAKLRKTLEQERVERKQRQSAKRQSSKEVEARTEQIQANEHTQKSAAPLPRKSSIKNLTARSIKPTEQEDASFHAKDNPAQNRRHSETSVLSARSRRRRLNAEYMTSAFIVPDITIQATALAASEVPELSKENRVVLEELAHHNGHNCTVCKRNPDHDGSHGHSITISKPVPASDRMPIPGPYEEEPTIRPSQVPSLALGTVIKSLEDEITHLKIQLAKYQALYNGHDPALSKRKRKSVQEKVQSSLQAIDVKSDQIYALYDVLEGQKRDGHELNDHEVEITMQSVGIDAASLHLRGGGGGANEAEEPKGQMTDRHPWDLSSEDEGEDELPWEGIESTVETTKSSFARPNRRRSAVA